MVLIWHLVGRLVHGVGRRETRLHVAAGERHFADEIRPVLVNPGAPGLQSLPRVEQWGLDLVVDPDGLDGLLRGVVADGGHGRDLFTAIADEVTR